LMSYIKSMVLMFVVVEILCFSSLALKFVV